MINVEKPVKRKSGIHTREAGKMREIVVSVLPDGTLGFRLLGTRDTYTLPILAGYHIAVKAHVRDVERLAKKIKKREGCRISTARKKARLQLKENLRGLS